MEPPSPSTSTSSGCAPAAAAEEPSPSTSSAAAAAAPPSSSSSDSFHDLSPATPYEASPSVGDATASGAPDGGAATSTASAADEEMDSGIVVEQRPSRSSAAAAAEESGAARPRGSGVGRRRPPAEVIPATARRRYVMRMLRSLPLSEAMRNRIRFWPDGTVADSSDSDDDNDAEDMDVDGTGDDDDDRAESNDSDDSSSSMFALSDESYNNPPEVDYESYASQETPAILLKPKLNHTWNVVQELKKREMGLLLAPGKSGKCDVAFEHRFYGSLHAVERLELMYKLKKHKGCVNSINFHPEGHLLASGSDDLNIVVWEWSTNTVRRVIKTNHKSNIFQSRFLYLNSSSQLNIASCARDGQVRLTQLPSGGGTPMKRLLATHAQAAHKLYTSPAEPHLIISAGEDGVIIFSDVREEKGHKLLAVHRDRSKIPLYSVVGHPLDVNELCVAGRSRNVLIYDRRKPGPRAQPVRKYCPEFFRDEKKNSKPDRSRLPLATYVTCAVYNHNGTEILASYNDDDIYLFDSALDCYTTNDSSSGFTYMYSGHRNSETTKGVAFFGPQSEFVVSGSDCANIYIWDKKTQTIVQWMMGDENGVVNCIESHPRFPILATSGLDKDVKIWVPSNEDDPKLTGLRETVIKNANDRVHNPASSQLDHRIFRFFEDYRHSSDSSDSNSGPEEPPDINTCRAF